MSQRTKKEPTNREILEVIQDQKIEILEVIQDQKVEILETLQGQIKGQKAEILEVIQDQKVEILETLQGQIHRLEQKMDNGFQSVDERFDAAFEIFATKDDLKDAVSNLVTKTEFNEFKNETYNRFDRITHTTSRLDDEDKAHLDWLRRHDKALEQLLG